MRWLSFRSGKRAGLTNNERMSLAMGHPFIIHGKPDLVYELVLIESLFS